MAGSNPRFTGEMIYPKTNLLVGITSGKLNRIPRFAVEKLNRLIYRANDLLSVGNYSFKLFVNIVKEGFWFFHKRMNCKGLTNPSSLTKAAVSKTPKLKPPAEFSAARC